MFKKEIILIAPIALIADYYCSGPLFSHPTTSLPSYTDTSYGILKSEFLYE
jgi:hypothetical protein